MYYRLFCFGCRTGAAHVPLVLPFGYKRLIRILRMLNAEEKTNTKGCSARTAVADDAPRMGRRLLQVESSETPDDSCIHEVLLVLVEAAVGVVAGIVPVGLQRPGFVDAVGHPPPATRNCPGRSVCPCPRPCQGMRRSFLLL